jgi:hypothetical protein
VATVAQVPATRRTRTPATRMDPQETCRARGGSSSRGRAGLSARLEEVPTAGSRQLLHEALSPTSASRCRTLRRIVVPTPPRCTLDRATAGQCSWQPAVPRTVGPTGARRARAETLLARHGASGSGLHQQQLPLDRRAARGGRGRRVPRPGGAVFADRRGKPDAYPGRWRVVYAWPIPVFRRSPQPCRGIGCVPLATRLAASLPL